MGKGPRQPGGYVLVRGDAARTPGRDDAAAKRVMAASRGRDRQPGPPHRRPRRQGHHGPGDQGGLRLPGRRQQAGQGGIALPLRCPAPPWTPPQARQLLREMFQAAIHAAQPARTLAAPCPRRRKGELLVIGAPARRRPPWPAPWRTPGAIRWKGWWSRATATRWSARASRSSRAAHPVPDAAGFHAAQRMLERVSEADRGRPRHRPDLGRRLRAAAAAAGRHVAGGPARRSTSRC